MTPYTLYREDMPNDPTGTSKFGSGRSHGWDGDTNSSSKSDNQTEPIHRPGHSGTCSYRGSAMGTSPVLLIWDATPNMSARLVHQSYQYRVPGLSSVPLPNSHQPDCPGYLALFDGFPTNTDNSQRGFKLACMYSTQLTG